MNGLQQGSEGRWHGSLDDVDYKDTTYECRIIRIKVGPDTYLGQFKPNDPLLRELESKLNNALESGEVVHLEGTFQRYKTPSYFTLRVLKIEDLEARLSRHFLRLSRT